eukprot:scaffold84431_cov47-Phaeocystis_antarctica.AAC.1
MEAVETVEAVTEAVVGDTLPTPTPARRRARSHHGALRGAPPACTNVRHGGCIEPVPRPMSRCTGSRPCPLTSCRTRHRVWAAVTAAAKEAEMAVVAKA